MAKKRSRKSLPTKTVGRVIREKMISIITDKNLWCALIYKSISKTIDQTKTTSENLSINQNIEMPVFHFNINFMELLNLIAEYLSDLLYKS